MRWQSLIPAPGQATRVLLITLVAVFLLVSILSWAGVDISPYFALMPGNWGVSNLVAWPLHVLYTPASNGFSFLVSLFVLAWMLGAMESRYGGRRVYQLMLLVALGPGLLAWATGTGLGLLGMRGPAWICGASPVAIAAAAAGVYVIRREREVYLFSSIAMTPTQLFGLLFGLAILNLVISRSLPHFVEELAAIGTGVLFARSIEGGGRSAPPRTSGTKLRVVGGKDRTLH
jgi:hypothetical protein